MKVLVVSATFPPATDGEAEHGHQIADRLAHAGHAVTVLTGRHEAIAPAAGFRVCPVMPAWRWRDLPHLVACLLQCRPDGVVLVFTARLFGEHPMITFLPTILRWVRPQSRLVTIVEIHRAPYIRGRATRLGRKLFEGLAGRRGVDYGYGTLLRDSHAVAALGPTILAGLQAQHPGVQSRALVIPPPPLVSRPQVIDAQARQQARLRLGAVPGTFLFAYFGFVYPGKGIETLLAALRRLHAQGHAVRLLMAGGGRGAAGGSGGSAEHVRYEQAMVELSHQLGIADTVAWPAGYASGAEGIALDLLAADAAVLPFDDGAELRRSSIAVMAAMGLPLVTTEPSAHEPAFVHERNVLLCPAQDAEQLAVAMGRLMSDAGLRARLQAGSLALAAEWFSWDQAIAKIAAALRGEAPR